MNFVRNYLDPIHQINLNPKLYEKLFKKKTNQRNGE